MYRVCVWLLFGCCLVWGGCSQVAILPGAGFEQEQLGVPCGDTRCVKGQTCHYFAQHKPLCVGAEGVPKELEEKEQGSASVACDGIEDCAQGETCARMIRATATYSVMLLCTKNRDISWEVVCHEKTDCPASHPVCAEVKTTYMGTYKICKKAA